MTYTVPAPGTVRWDRAMKLAACVDQYDGITKAAICAELHWPPHRVDEAIRDIRMMHGDTEPTTIVVWWEGRNPFYRMVNTWDEYEDWALTRLRTDLSRDQVSFGSDSSIVRALKGRNTAGAKAVRKLAKYHKRAQEDLDEILAEVESV